MAGTQPTSEQVESLLILEWSKSDRMRVVTLLGAAGLVASVAMAVVGLPPVDLHGPLHRMGIMDPLCGGTRAARLTTQGRLLEAWRYNPLGILATFAAALAVARLAVGLVMRHWLNVRVAWTPTRIRLALALLAIATIALEIRQQGRADLLLKPY
jgi:hypothetical protein